MVVAGWYDDPAGSGGKRWWDGQVWTDEVTAPPGTVPPGGVPAAAEAPAAGYGTSPPLAGQAPLLTSPPPNGLGAKRQLEQENARLRSALEQMGVGDHERLRAEITAMREESDVRRQELRALQREVVETRERVILQEVGIYEYAHPLDDATAYKERLDQVQRQYKDLAKSSRAIAAIRGWTVNGSVKDGERMVKDFSKLMLRAYNNEADAIVRSMRPYALEAAKARLDKAAISIVKLGKSMQLAITDEYHRLRLLELELSADYLAKKAEEKEAEREERARLREEKKLQQEIQRERDKLDKERTHYEQALEKLRSSGASEEEIAAAEAKLAEIDEAVQGIEEREANVRAGYVYVISNIGSFGERMVKIGMTRRLEPMDRVRELGDASVPFRYDLHALIFSDDAVSLETQLHQAFSAQRVNRVNLRREFFYATPLEVKEVLTNLDGSIVEYVDEPEAIEWHQSGGRGVADASDAAS